MDPPPGSNDWLAKIQPSFESFSQACASGIRPGRNVSIDEQLILFKGRSKHTMQIASKSAGEGFKIYSLCVGNYLFACYFASPIGPKATRIVGMQSMKDLPPTSTVCVRLAQRLPKPWEYVIYLDNFFTREALLKKLKKLGFGACGTSKRGSGVHNDLVVFKELSKKARDWGTRLITTIDDEILCLGWQDNNTVLMMSTAHTAADAAASELRSI